MFQQEVVLSFLYFRGKKQYLVKWSGLDENGDRWADTWEPAQNIEVDENEALLKKFFQKQNSDPPSKKVKKEVLLENTPL